MNFTSYPKIKITTALIMVLGFFSCGSYQYAGSDNDGIYSSEGEVVYVEKVEQSPATQDNSYYQNYFKEKRMQYDAMNSESEIFTDADSYSSEGNFVEKDSLNNSYVGYGGWGSDSDEIVINYYNNNWVDPLWGPYGWGWGAGWGWGWNYPYYGWGWSVGWGWGYPYYGWGWGAGWGWSAGWGWGYPYYGWGWNYPYYGGYYNNRGVPINGRRGDARLAGNYNRNTSLTSNRRNSLTRDYDAVRSDIRTRTSTEYSNNNIRSRNNYSTSRTRGNYYSGNNYSTSRIRNNSSYSSPSSTSRSSSSNSTVRPSRSSSSSSSGGRSFSGGSTSRGSSGSGGGRSSGSSGGGRRR